MKDKNLTIDDLSVIIKQGFDSVDEQFNGMRKDMNDRFDKIENRLQSIELRLVNVVYQNEFQRSTGSNSGP